MAASPIFRPDLGLLLLAVREFEPLLPCCRGICSGTARIDVCKQVVAEVGQAEWIISKEERAGMGSLLPLIQGRLPLDVQIKLLEYLPLPSLCCFQAVCRSWYRAVRSLKRVTVHGKCYIKRGEESGCLSIYSTLERGWLNLPLDYLPSELREAACLVSTCPTGLICLHVHGSGGATIVSNLLTRSWIRLPEPPEVAAQPDKDLVMFTGMQTEDVGCSEARSFIVVYVRVRWQEGAGWSCKYISLSLRKAKWESSVMDLEAGEVFLGGVSYNCCCAALHGKTLYFSSSCSHMRFAAAGKILLVGERPVTRRKCATVVGLLNFDEERKEWEPFASNPHWKVFGARILFSVVGCEDRVVVCDTTAPEPKADVKARAWTDRMSPFELSFAGKVKKFVPRFYLLGPVNLNRA